MVRILASILILALVLVGLACAETAGSPSQGVTHELHGTYTATVWNYDFGTSVKQTITFEGDTMTINDKVTGKTICRYFIPGGLESGQVIRYTNVITGEEWTSRFKYSAEYDAFTIGEGPIAITYYR